MASTRFAREPAAPRRSSPHHRSSVPCGLLLLLLVAACTDAPLGPSEGEGEIVRITAVPLLSAGGNPQITVDPVGASVSVGDILLFTALTASGEPVSATWSSSNPSVGVVSDQGRFTALAAGSTTLTARSRNRSATAAITVTAPASSGPVAPGTPPAPSGSCSELPHLRLVEVTTSAQLGSAIGNARAGDLIRLAPGSYSGRWTLRASGTAASPISLCGGRDAVLADTRYDGGAVLRLSGASHWVLHGFTVRTALWGVVLEGSNHNRLSGLHVHDIGQEAVRIRLNSSHNVLQGLRVHDTGRRGWNYQQWGEGVYVGSWSGHWQDGQPDRSDHNRVLDSHFGPNVTAEHIDVKEGTTGTIIRGNTFDGRGMENNASQVDSWVLVQGNDGVVEQNRGSVSRTHGFRVWPGDGSWGQRNVFRDNVADVRADGYGFVIQGKDNKVSCKNNVTNAKSGFANVTCSN
jgi:hypothetical protein